MVLGTGFPNKDGIGGSLHWADERGEVVCGNPDVAGERPNPGRQA